MTMSLEQLNSIDDVRVFLEGTQAVIFGVTATKKERYRWCNTPFLTSVKTREFPGYSSCRGGTPPIAECEQILL
jgi:hypothetical protein